jgi:hypothetical protein
VTGNGLLIIQTVIAGLTVILSVIGAAFVTGSRIGSIETTIHTISERLTRIEALFELKLKGKDDLCRFRINRTAGVRSRNARNEHGSQPGVSAVDRIGGSDE